MKIKIKKEICSKHSECSNADCYYKNKHDVPKYYDNKQGLKNCPFKSEGEYPRCVDACYTATFTQVFRESHECWHEFFTFGHIIDTTRKFYQDIMLRWFILVGNMFALPHHSIKDGYWLVFLSPIVLVWWALCSVTLIVSSILIIIPYILIILSYVPATIWALLLEAPAEFINKNNK